MTCEKGDATMEDEKRPSIGAEVATLLMDAGLSYPDIVDAILVIFPNAKTTARSVASVAARLRKSGVEVPLRRAAKRSAEK